MFAAKLMKVASQSAVRTLGLRVAIVGANFAVMLGLAALLGLETYGALVALWAAALVAGTVVSLGGPVTLLRFLTDGQGMRLGDVARTIVIYPAVLALVTYVIGANLWSGFPWFAILAVGFCVNAMGCVASVMRALGSVQASMALRDAGPQAALGIAAVMIPGAQVNAILLASGVIMAVLALAAVLWCASSKRMNVLWSSRMTSGVSLSQWGTSVLGMVVAQIDLILGATVLSAEQLGIYALLRRVANLVALPVTVATWVSAPAVSAAHGAGDVVRLQAASAAGSQIALLPGLVLCALGVMALPLLPLFVPELAGGGHVIMFALLLAGALGQVVFASSFTVATLCGAATLAMGARLLMVALYLLSFAWWGAKLTATANALGYTIALTMGGAALWWVIKRRLGVDTSAAVLLRAKEGLWKPY